MEIMKNVEINNPEIKDLLDQWVELAFQGQPYDQFNTKRFKSVGEPGDKHSPDWAGNKKEYYTSDEHRDEIIAQGSGHLGWPLTGRFYDMRKHNQDLSIDLGHDPIEQYAKLDGKMQTTLATNANALASVYPPGGFISWHNNANSPAYNLILTWSENGNGYWKHVNPYTGETEIVQDKPGWQCKAFYFGAYEENDPLSLVYHMAASDCWRMTCSYMFNRTHKMFWEDMIEEIETP